MPMISAGRTQWFRRKPMRSLPKWPTCFLPRWGRGTHCASCASGYSDLAALECIATCPRPVFWLFRRGIGAYTEGSKNSALINPMVATEVALPLPV